MSDDGSGWFSAKDRPFYIVFGIMILLIVAAVLWGEIPFTGVFTRATKPDDARAPLAVSVASLWLFFVAFSDFLLLLTGRDPINVAVPSALDAWVRKAIAVLIGALEGRAPRVDLPRGVNTFLPGLVVVLIGALIGTTIFR